MRSGLHTRFTVIDDDSVRQIGGHDEIVLDNEACLLGAHNEALDDLGGADALLAIQVSGRLVDL